MHYGVEEMFFVLAGTPTVRTPKGEESFRPEMSCTSLKAQTGCTISLTRRTSRFACSPSPQSDFPMLSLTQSGESHGWRLVIPSVRCLKGVTTESSLAFDLPPESQSTRSRTGPVRPSSGHQQARRASAMRRRKDRASSAVHAMACSASSYVRVAASGCPAGRSRHVRLHRRVRRRGSRTAGRMSATTHHGSYDDFEAYPSRDSEVRIAEALHRA